MVAEGLAEGLRRMRAPKALQRKMAFPPKEPLPYEPEPLPYGPNRYHLG